MRVSRRKAVQGIQSSHTMPTQIRDREVRSPGEKPANDNVAFGNTFLQQPDSLQQFQRELEGFFQAERTKTETFNNMMTPKPQRRAASHFFPSQTDIEINSQSKPFYRQRGSKRELDQLKSQIESLKGAMQSQKNLPKVEQKLDRLLAEMAMNRQLSLKNDREASKPTVIPIYPPYPPQYPPPQQYPPPPQYPPPQQHQSPAQTQPIDPPPSRSPPPPSTSSSNRRNKFARKTQARNRLRKYFFAVLFTKFVHSEAKALSKLRKATLRKFYQSKFDQQIQQMKNWLVQAHSHTLSIMLQKSDAAFDFTRNKLLANEKQKLLLQLTLIGCNKMKVDSTPAKIGNYVELLSSLCRRGSFCMSRFWTAKQMDFICISGLYGCIRIDPTLEKVLIAVIVFMKMLVFNLLLQPHKFDSINFPKAKQPLQQNMYLLASTYYHAVKAVITKLLNQQRSDIFELGNWLNVRKQFIVECSEPLVFNTEYPSWQQLISGLLQDEDMVFMKAQNEWKKITQRLEQIIEALHKEVVKKDVQMRRNMKYKLHN